MNTKIQVDGYTFKVILTNEIEGYVYTHRMYSLYYGNKLISTDASSLKDCYLKAWKYLDKK